MLAKVLNQDTDKNDIGLKKFNVFTPSNRLNIKYLLKVHKELSVYLVSLSC